MDLELYDEFGNYIGPEIEDSDSESLPGEDSRQDLVEERSFPLVHSDQRNELQEATRVILHEDKKYYPNAEEIYGEGVDIVVQEEDAQPLSQPIVPPPPLKKVSGKHPKPKYSDVFLSSLTEYPEFSRNVAIIGHLHHGKTSFVDLLVNETHIDDVKNKEILKYTDTLSMEKNRGVSIKASPVSLPLKSSKGKTHLINIMDTPGHVNFSDEVTASIRLVDGVVLVVDAIEGVMINTERVIKHALIENMSLVVLINKIDRLIVELKLPPTDAYFKLNHTINEINAIIKAIDPAKCVSPELGNVCFASSLMGFCFSLKSISRIYTDLYEDFDAVEFSKRLWGDIYYNQDKRNFVKKDKSVPGVCKQHTFVMFVLEPIYKIFAQVLGEDIDTLRETLSEIGVRLTCKELESDVKPLLKSVFKSIFNNTTGFVDMVLEYIPSPAENNANKVERIYTGNINSSVGLAMKTLNRNGPLMIHITKLYNCSGPETFEAFGRIMSGTVRLGQKVRVLGEGYTLSDEEDMMVQTISSVEIFQSQYSVKVKSLVAGNLVLLSGVHENIIKTGTIVDCLENFSDKLFIFAPLRFDTVPVMKVAVEPENPTDLPKMFDGLRRVNKSYPILQTRVEESGEHVIFGTGELYLDCVLYDLRKFYSEIDLKVADPVVKFCETVISCSALKCYAETSNKQNKIVMIAEPLEESVSKDIETKAVSINLSVKELGKWFTEKYKWDMMAARNIWAFGPDSSGPNVLINDVIPTETDLTLLKSIKNSIKQGFQWATREGPLCEEPIRNVKFRILDAKVSPLAINRGGGQIIPTTRKVCYSSFLTASPRLMEPIYLVEIQAPADCVSFLYAVLARRRGHIIQDVPKPGTPIYTIKALIPTIDSWGFETDLRTYTQGQAFVQQVFDHWQMVPGDPLDKSIVLKPLEPSPPAHLARDFMIKTRMRKGLSEDVAIVRFFDDPMILELNKVEGGLFTM